MCLNDGVYFPRLVILHTLSPFAPHRIRFIVILRVVYLRIDIRKEIGNVRFEELGLFYVLYT